MRGRAWLLLVLLAGCGGGSASNTDIGDGPAPAATERCHTAQLQARVESATATITVFSLTDTSDVACVLEGYARLELVDRAGAALDVQPSRLTDVPARRVTVAPGKAVAFELHTRATGGSASCTPVTAARVRILAPDEIEPLTVDAGPGIAGCDGQFGVTAIHAAS